MTANDKTSGEAEAKQEVSRETDSGEFTNSTLFKAFLAERDEIQKHKWYESEKAGRDIGTEQALVSWIMKHRKGWLRRYQAGQ